MSQKKCTEPRQKPGATTDAVARPTAPVIIQVTDEERDHIAGVAERLLQRYGSIDAPEFRRVLPSLAGQCLPERHYRILAHFRDAFGDIDYGAVIFKGMVSVNQDELGPTPVRWQEVTRQHLKPYEFVTALIHGALGGTLAEFFYQRKGGGFSHSVIPDPAMKAMLTGAGEVELTLHTEDSNLDHSADFITFFWLRNNEQVPCHLFSIRVLDLDEKSYAQRLREPIFKFPPDANYGAVSNPQGDMERTFPLLYGNPRHPWLRVDFIDQCARSAHQSQPAQQALEAFEKDVQAAAYVAFVPGGGDLCVLNNKMCAHGRGAFKQGVDPAGNPVEKRWMLRMMSVVDRFAFYVSAVPGDPAFSQEMHFGQTFELC